MYNCDDPSCLHNNNSINNASNSLQQKTMIFTKPRIESQAIVKLFTIILYSLNEDNKIKRLHINFTVRFLSL